MTQSTKTKGLEIMPEINMGNGRVYKTEYRIACPNGVDTEKMVTYVERNVMAELNKAVRSAGQDAKVRENGAGEEGRRVLEIHTKDESVQLGIVAIYLRRTAGERKIVIEYSDGFNSVPNWIDSVLKAFAGKVTNINEKELRKLSFAPERITPRKEELEMENEGRRSRQSTAIPSGGVRGFM